MDSSSRMRAGWAIAAVSGLALASSGALAAGLGGPEKVRYTAADQAAARAAVVRSADLRPAGAWQGGTKKVTKADLAPLSCPGFHPKVSDLVVTGAADSVWQSGPTSLESLAVVLRTEDMVRSDWARSVQTPGAVACAAESLGKIAGANVKLVSYRKVAFPHVAPHAQAFRFELSVTTQGVSIPVVVDTVVLGTSRTELTLTSGGPKATVPPTSSLARVARAVLARVHA
jgi:hypothetical protein